jgi:uncharacterized protein RhaS with RHS repeats
LGRWLSEDPIGEEGGLNLYGYVLNDPTGLFDELGLQSVDSVTANSATAARCFLGDAASFPSALARAGTDFAFRGIVRSAGLRGATHQQVANAFKQLGTKVTGHFVKRVKDPRIAESVKTFADLEKIMRNGCKTFSRRTAEGSEYWDEVYKGVKMVYDATKNTWVTITPL